jgi:hypothetical protein
VISSNEVCSTFTATNSQTLLSDYVFAIRTHGEGPSVFINKNYDHKCSYAKKKSGRTSQGA